MADVAYLIIEIEMVPARMCVNEKLKTHFEILTEISDWESNPVFTRVI